MNEIRLLPPYHLTVFFPSLIVHALLSILCILINITSDVTMRIDIQLVARQTISSRILPLPVYTSPFF